MGLFDSFFLDNGSGIVPRYVKGMDRNTLIKSIEENGYNPKDMEMGE